MQKLRAIFGGFSPIAVTALLSVVILVSVTAVRITLALRPAAPEIPTPAQPAAVAAVDDGVDPFSQQSMILLGAINDTDMDATSTTDHLSMIGPMIASEMLGTYARIRESGKEYTNDDLQNEAAKLAEHMKAMVAYEAFTNDDFTIDENSSTDRVRAYRDQMVTALKPLDSIPSAEYAIYGHYVETTDPKYLKQLQDAAAAYRISVENASKIVVPRDALNYHRDLLNALRAFGAVLDGLVSHGDDPFASVALLRTYNEKEQEIYDTFDAMRAYYGKKQL